MIFSGRRSDRVKIVDILRAASDGGETRAARLDRCSYQSEHESEPSGRRMRLKQNPDAIQKSSGPPA